MYACRIHSQTMLLRERKEIVKYLCWYNRVTTYAMVCDHENSRRIQIIFFHSPVKRPFLQSPTLCYSAIFVKKQLVLIDHWPLQSPISSDAVSVFPISESVVRNEIAHCIFFRHSWPGILKCVSISEPNFLMYHHEVVWQSTGVDGELKITQFSPLTVKKNETVEMQYSFLTNLVIVLFS